LHIVHIIIRLRLTTRSIKNDIKL